MARAPGPPSRAARNLVVGVLLVLVSANWLGAALLGALVDRHPGWLIALNASNRNLVLASGYLGPLPYYLIGLARLFAPDPLFYLLGVWYGDAAVRWMEERTPTYGDLMRRGERLFGRAGYPLVFVAPNNPVCLFAGAAGMPVVPFVVVNVAGTLARLWLLRTLGDVFSGPLDAIRSFITTYRVPVIVVSVLLVGITIVSERRKGRDEALALANLDEGIAAAAAELAAEAEGTEGSPGDSVPPA